jgi:hypothetical protein
MPNSPHLLRRRPTRCLAAGRLDSEHGRSSPCNRFKSYRGFARAANSVLVATWGSGGFGLGPLSHRAGRFSNSARHRGTDSNRPRPGKGKETANSMKCPWNRDSARATKCTLSNQARSRSAIDQGPAYRRGPIPGIPGSNSGGVCIKGSTGCFSAGYGGISSFTKSSSSPARFRSSARWPDVPPS